MNRGHKIATRHTDKHGKLYMRHRLDQTVKFTVHVLGTNATILTPSHILTKTRICLPTEWAIDEQACFKLWMIPSHTVLARPSSFAVQWKRLLLSVGSTVIPCRECVYACCLIASCKKGARTVLSSQTIRYCQDGVQDLFGNSLAMETSASSADLVSEAGTLWSAWWFCVWKIFCFHGNASLIGTHAAIRTCWEARGIDTRSPRVRPVQVEVAVKGEQNVLCAWNRRGNDCGAMLRNGQRW